MSIVVPSTFDAPGIGDFSSGRHIEDGTFERVNEALNYCWSRLGARVAGLVFEPPLQVTEEVAWVQVNAGVGTTHDLTEWFGSSRLLQEIDGGAAQIDLEAFGSNVKVRLTVLALDDGTQLEQDLVTCGETSGTGAVTLALAQAQRHEGENIANPLRHVGYVLEVQASPPPGETGVSVPGLLYQVDVYERIAVAASVP